jgi:hypothetical protein
MLRQIDIKVPGLPPRLPRAGEPSLFSELSPQKVEVLAFLQAAQRAARDLEIDSFAQYDNLQLRVIVPGRNGGRPPWGMASAEAIALLLCTRGRDRAREAHLGDVAGFSLFEREDRLLSVHVEVDAGKESGYEVQLAELPSALTFVEGGVEKPFPRPPRRGPLTGPDDALAFLDSLRALLRSEMNLGAVLRMTPTGALMRFQEEYQGEWLEYGPFELFGGAEVPGAFEVPLVAHDLYPTYDFLVNNPMEWWWPLKIVVRPPMEEGVIAFYTSHGLGPQGSRCRPPLAFFTPAAWPAAAPDLAGGEGSD